MSEKFAVGDTVIVTSMNRGREYTGTVAKVGRKLVTITNKWGQPEVFRIETGSKNDDYGHETVWTLAEHAERSACTEQHARVKAHGVSFDYGTARRFDSGALRRLADLLDEIDPGSEDHR